MKLGYYDKWIKELSFSKLGFKSLDCFEDIVRLSFKEGRFCLYISQNTIFFETDNSFFPEDIWQPLSGSFNFHLNHSALIDCGLLNNDRIIELYFTKFNIYNQKQDYFLILELIPKYKNIILTEEQNNEKIIRECQKKFTFMENRERQILPGIVYNPPKTSFKHQPLDDIPINVNDYFKNHFYNVEIQNKKDNLLKSLTKEITREIEKEEKKLAKQQQELESANQIEHWKKSMELLKTSLHDVLPGASSIEVVDYFNDDMRKIIIELNPELSPVKNLDFYIKKYKKSLRGQQIIKDNIKKTLISIEYHQEKLNSLNNITNYFEIKELPTLHSQLPTPNSPLQTPNSKKGGVGSHFRILKISESWDIYIGRSSKENDMLTCKVAKPDDWWFHTRIFHGTHVVLRNYRKFDPPDDLVNICCRLAAYYSKAKNSTNVPVDYTQIRYVRKPRGAALGYVVYTNQKTYYADPIDFREASIEINKIYH